MPTSALPPKPLLDSLASYPHWFVAACVTLVLAAVIWVLAKALKWSLYALIAFVLIGGLGASIWLLFH
jgi:CHASE2 domain-containing sensor protein